VSARLTSLSALGAEPARADGRLNLLSHVGAGPRLVPSHGPLISALPDPRPDRHNEPGNPVSGEHKFHSQDEATRFIKDAATRGLYALESAEHGIKTAGHTLAHTRMHRGATGLASLAATAAVAEASGDVLRALETKELDDAKHALSSTASATGALAKIAVVTEHANNTLARRAGVIASAAIVKYTLHDFGEAGMAIGHAMRSGEAEDVREAGKATGFAVANAGWSAKMVVLPTAHKITQHRAVQAATLKAVEGSAPEAVTKAASKAAADVAVEGGTKAEASKAAMQAAAKKGAPRQVYRSLGRSAGKAAFKQAAKTGISMGARFMPGLNAGIAVAETAQAVAIQTDPDAPVGKKVAAWATAGLATTAAVLATNPLTLPLSWVAAGGTLAVGFVRDLW